MRIKIIGLCLASLSLLLCLISLECNNNPTSVTLPTVQFSTSAQTVNKNSGTAAVNVVLSTTSGSKVTVPFTVLGVSTVKQTDYTIGSTSVEIPAGSLSGNIPVSIVNNDVYQPTPMKLILQLGAPTNARLGTRILDTVVITDNNVYPTVGFVTPGDEGDTATRQVVDWSAGPATIDIGLTSIAQSAITIPITVMSGSTANSPGDYTLNTASLVIAAGDSIGTISVSVKPGTSYQTFKTVILTLGQPDKAKLGGYLFDTVFIVDAQGFGAIYNLADNEVQGWIKNPESPKPFSVFTGSELISSIDGEAGTYLLRGGLVNVYQDLKGPAVAPDTNATMCVLIAMDCGTIANATGMFAYKKDTYSASVAVPGYETSVAVGAQSIGGNQTVFAHFKAVYFELQLGGYNDMNASSDEAGLLLQKLEAKTN